MKNKKKVLVMLSRTLPELHSGVADYAREHGWNLTSNLAFGGRSLEGWKGDGIIASLGSDESFVKQVLGFNLPVVDLVGTQPDIDVARVELDNFETAKMVADEFIKRGFINFAFWGHSGWPVERIRRQHFIDYISNYSEHYKVFDLSEPFSILNQPYEEFLSYIGEKLKTLPKPVAIMAMNDFCGAELVEACDYAGINVPEEVAVIGVNNNILVSETISTPLSSVDANLRERGYLAASLLDSILNGEKVPNKHIQLAPRIIIHRASSEVMAVNNDAVMHAIKYIRLNYGSDIGVEQVIEAAGVSRRNLEQAFNKHLGRSIKKEILRTRIEKAKVLLKTSNEAIKDIALMVGFNYQQPFYNAFIKYEGCTPREFRNKT